MYIFIINTVNKIQTYVFNTAYYLLIYMYKYKYIIMIKLINVVLDVYRIFLCLCNTLLLSSVSLTHFITQDPFR